MWVRGVAAVLLAGLLAAAAEAAPVAIRTGRLVDPEAGTAEAGRVVVVDGGRVVSVDRAAPPPGARVIDLSSFTVLPGLFDAHTHLCASPVMEGGTPDELLRGLAAYTSQVPTPYRALEGAAHARAMLEAGFTTVRDLGNAGLYADTALREAVERGLVPGPTIVNAGRIIAPFGGQFRVPPERPDLAAPEYLHADGAEAVRRAVRENVHFGARVIKLVVDDQPYAYSVEEIRAAVDEARGAGLAVAAHCVSERGARHAIEAGVASIEHGFPLSDALLERMKAKGIVLVGTDFTPEMAGWIGIGDAYPTIVDRLRRARRIGVTMAYGSDAYMASPDERTRGQLALGPLRTAVEAGLSPREILRTMITNAAGLLGLSAQRGRVAPGLAADLIATRGNPLEDPLALNEVVWVMKDGRVVLDRTRAP